MNSNCFKAIFLLIITSFPLSLGAQPLNKVMSWNGYGQVFFGDDLETMEKWMGEKALIREGTEHCYYADFPSYPEVSFMMVDGVFKRVYRNAEDVKNFINVNIGESLNEIKRRFRGKICNIASTDYISELKNCPLIVYPSDNGDNYLFLNKLKTKGFILLEHDGKVYDFSAGLADSITLKEGCW